MVSGFGSLFRAAKRVAAAWCWRYNVQNGVSGYSFGLRNREKRVLCFVDKTKIRLLGLEKKRKQPTMKSDVGPEIAGANVPERWRGWRLGRRPGFRCSDERKDIKVATTVSTLVGRSVLISLVPSVAEADVTTVDGLESTIKSARDQKRWKLVAV
ncbi:hypothetical protein B296_00053755 [Ensete ventricosum]|uniref:Uncharacterized protein n=1 Tax=Ensete ventricosum TaxID=4639 RepID=A0A426X5X3_ENSVE|nr:hypothetical protein B296_00053755 [Ensete ventricosum]